MASTTFLDMRNGYNNSDFFFEPKTLVMHDTMNNPVFTDWFNPDYSTAEPPKTVFGAGMISDSTGIKITESLKWKEITSQGYDQAVRRSLESSDKTFTVEYQEILKRSLLEAVAGVDLPETLSAAGTLDYIQGGARKEKGLRTYIINWEDTNDGLVARVDILPKVVVVNTPDFEIKGSDPDYSKVDYSVYLDAEVGYSHRTIWGGAGFVKRAAALGYKLPA